MPTLRQSSPSIACLSTGKPYCKELPQWHCSITHSKSQTIAAIARIPIGVDCEGVRNISDIFAAWFTTKEEEELLRHLVPHHFVRTCIWSIKEAAAKADKRIYPLREYRIVQVAGCIVATRSTSWWIVLLGMHNHTITSFAFSMKSFTEQQLQKVLIELFDIQEQLSSDTDLMVYIKDSIDLGELLAHVEHTYGVVPKNPELFKTHSKLSDVHKILTNEITT